MGPSYHHRCPYENRRKADNRGTGRRSNVTREAEMGAWDSSSPQGLEEAESILPLSLHRECGPSDTLMLNSGLQNCERITFCCFKQPYCDSLVEQTQELIGLLCASHCAGRGEEVNMHGLCIAPLSRHWDRRLGRELQLLIQYV